MNRKNWRRLLFSLLGSKLSRFICGQDCKKDDIKTILSTPSKEDAARTFAQILSAEMGARGSVLYPIVPGSLGRQHFIYAISWLLIIKRLEFLSGRGESTINACYAGLNLNPISESVGAEYFEGGDVLRRRGKGNSKRETHTELEALIEEIIRYKSRATVAYPSTDEYTRPPVFIHTNVEPMIAAGMVYDRHALSGAEGQEIRSWIIDRLCHDKEPSVAKVLATLSPSVKLDLRVAESLGNAIVYGDMLLAHGVKTYPVNPMSIDDYKNPIGKRGIIGVPFSGAFAIIRHGIGNVEEPDETNTVRLAAYVNRPIAPVPYSKAVLARGLSLKALDDMKNLMKILILLEPDFIGKKSHWLAKITLMLLKKRFTFRKEDVMLKRIINMAERLRRRGRGDIDIFPLSGSNVSEVREWLMGRIATDSWLMDGWQELRGYHIRKMLS